MWQHGPVTEVKFMDAGRKVKSAYDTTTAELLCSIMLEKI